MTGLAKAGFAKADITPRVGAAMAGYAARKGGAEGCHDQLYAHVMVMEDRTQAVVIVNLDLLEVPSQLTRDLRKKISTVRGIPECQIFITATHTHSGPLVSEWFGEVPEPETIDGIMAGTIKAVEDARETMVSIQVRCGQGTLRGVAKNRRTLEETPDPNLQVLGFYAGERLIGCLVNFALHPTILGADNLLYSADYPGYVRSFIAQHHPHCITLVLNGAAGNINIGYSADTSALGGMIDFRTFGKAEEVGQAIAEQAMAVLQQSKCMKKVKISVGLSRIRLPLKVLPSLFELEDSISRHHGIQRVYQECLRDAVKKLEVDGGQALDVELQALSIGETVLVGIPGEPFAEVGLAIKDRWPGKQVMVVGYANGYVGYMPTYETHLEGGYEAETTVFDPSMAAMLVKEARHLIDNLLVRGRDMT